MKGLFWNLLQLISAIVLVAPIYNALRLVIRAWRLGNYCARAATRAPMDLTSYPRISILLPVLREQNLVHDTLQTFTNLDYPQDRFQVVLVTTEREINDLAEVRRWLTDQGDNLSLQELYSILKGRLNQKAQKQLVQAWRRGKRGAELLTILDDYQTTADVVAAALASGDYSNVEHYHHIGKQSSKAAQLNYGVASLPTRWKENESYIAVFDFDARPLPQSLRFVAAAAITDYPEAIQQPALPILADEQTSAGAMADAILHVLRALGIEAYSWKRQTSLVGRRGLALLGGPDLYFVGIGLYVRADALQQAGGFPHPVDDVPLGFEAAQRRWRVGLAPTVSYTQSYPTLKAAITSRTLVYLAYARVLVDSLQSIYPPRWRLATLVEGLVWIFGPLVCAISLGVAVWQHGFICLAGWSIAYQAATVLKLWVGWRLAHRFLPASPLHISVTVLSWSLLQPLWRALSAWRLLLTLVQQQLHPRGEIRFQKTER